MKKFPWPHYIDEDAKSVSVYVASGWPTVMIVPKKVEEYFPGYTAKLVSEKTLLKLSSGTDDHPNSDL